ncbi:uncharacterized protein LOC135922110 [Gordionus sp. m RMFG-2023]|uniref:uncharacterized protein LOC135922110 n=1 Tax=Gordionus sp. m RMFG-2023 TaxID=3053472 RepID=UPI0031FD614A
MSRDMCSSLKVSDTNNSNIVTVRYADEEAITSKSQCSNLNREFILSKKTQSSDTRHNNVGVFGSKPYTIAEEDEKEIVQLLFEGERKQNHEINLRNEITSPAKYSVKNGHGLDESIKTKKTVSFCADVRSLEIDDYPRASTTVFLEGANECRKGVENEPDLVGIDNDDNNNAQKTRFHDVHRCVSRVFSYFGILTFTSQGDAFKGKFRDDLNTGGRPMTQDLLGEIKENYQKLLKLGDNRENPEILEILLKELCPEIVRMLSKAIPPENSASYLNNLGTKLWKFINDQNMGLNSSPAPKIFQNLINALQKHSFDGVPVNASGIEIENETHQFALVNAFICGLLNLRHLGVWLRTIDRKIGGFLELEESALDLIDLLRYLPFRLYIPSVIHICLRSADQNNLLVSGLGKREKVDDSNATTTSIKYGGKDHFETALQDSRLG